MDFSTYMNSLPDMKVKKIKELAKLTVTSENTIYRWISGAVTPPAMKQELISKHLNIPIEVLFPVKLEA